MDEYKFYFVAEKLYHYAWHELADNILEESKKIFKEGSEVEKKSRKQLLLHTLDKLLRALHPFMPYITEEIWSEMPTGMEREVDFYWSRNGRLQVQGRPCTKEKRRHLIGVLLKLSVNRDGISMVLDKRNVRNSAMDRCRLWLIGWRAQSLFSCGTIEGTLLQSMRH